MAFFGFKLKSVILAFKKFIAFNTRYITRRVDCKALCGIAAQTECGVGYMSAVVRNGELGAAVKCVKRVAMKVENVRIITSFADSLQYLIEFSGKIV